MTEQNVVRYVKSVGTCKAYPITLIVLRKTAIKITLQSIKSITYSIAVNIIRYNGKIVNTIQSLHYVCHQKLLILLQPRTTTLPIKEFIVNVGRHPFRLGKVYFLAIYFSRAAVNVAYNVYFLLYHGQNILSQCNLVSCRGHTTKR